MQKPTLVILAAGMASRYGKMKQIEGFGPNKETIMDYSIFDAIRAGFEKVVFIIREEFEETFKAIMEPKLAGKIKTAYVYQHLTDFVHADAAVSPERSKPWGTAHAVLCAKDEVKENFVVINADDFYGEDGFRKAYEFCTTACSDTNYGIIGYTLSKTLSKNGSVSRGVCKADANGKLVSINERTKIYWKGEQVFFEENGQEFEEDPASPVSMNFWCFSPGVFALSESLFSQFIKERGMEPKAEFFIPIVADHFINTGKGTIQIVGTDAEWFGVTYPEDAPTVEASISALVNAGAYPPALWS
ncbi:sugar phosphate nucleotidyltransferase [Phnomibacter ginsenosidimutans]|uniref:Nucleotidyltransferase n=1 Tax=Phnomibacter ginsenosidimutans TaxID=2676868 RepID=A0A6I6GLR7_9BACT|nr:sugar phosphate nucleotidyltransferase [Phnomibacter ginsenosidimutans]QGW28608.1 nucleotidyltransferase [Phnomibacter ginsenosidimutans]